MTCREATRFLADYISGELSAPVRERFEAHLAVCPPCVAYLESYRETIRLSREAFGGSEDSAAESAPPAKAPEELVRAIRASLKGASRKA